MSIMTSITKGISIRDYSLQLLLVRVDVVDAGIRTAY